MVYSQTYWLAFIGVILAVVENECARYPIIPKIFRAIVDSSGILNDFLIVMFQSIQETDILKRRGGPKRPKTVRTVGVEENVLDMLEEDFYSKNWKCLECYTIKCYRCSSLFEPSCETYFSTTNVLLNETTKDTFYDYNGNHGPKLRHCEGVVKAYVQYKYLCLKRVILVPGGPKVVTRSCEIVKNEFKVGACPEYIQFASDNDNVSFCETCDTDRCNSAGRNSLIVAGLVPAVIMWLGK